MTVFGYARASMRQQSLESQVAALKEAGIAGANIFTDGPGREKSERSGLGRLCKVVGNGDGIAVTRIDRLGGNLNELIDFIEKMTVMGVVLYFLEDDLSTENGMGPLMVKVLMAAARAERQRIHERTCEGRIEAREKGVKFGRKPTIDREKIQHLRVQGVGAADIARQMNIGRSTVYKILNALSRERKTEE